MYGIAIKCTYLYLCLCRRPVLIGATDVNAVVTTRATVSGVAVSAKHTPDDVTQMWNIVHVR